MKKRALSTLLVLVLCLGLVPPALAHAEEGSGFLVPRNSIDIRGDAYYDKTEGCYVLTEEKDWQNGSLWFSQVRCNDSFKLSLDFYTGDNAIHADGRPGGDGICVAFYSDANASGEAGLGLGFEGCSGYAVELDTYSNDFDPDYYHIALIRDTVRNHLSAADASAFVKDEKWHHLTVENHNGTCTVFVDGMQVLSQSGVYPDGKYNIGITAATGAGYNLHKVKNIELLEAVWKDASDWAGTELMKAEELDLIPDILLDTDLTQPITRAEFAAVAVKVFENLSGGKAVPVVVNPFTDTKDLEVLKAYQVGAVNGTSATTFTPNALLNREQCAAMLTRVFKRITLAGWTLDTDSQFRLDYRMPARFADDADISDYARDSVYFMAANGIINGVGGNKFAPKNTTTAQEAQRYANATREQALAIAVRMVENLK